jgi:HD-like signal output (HDOD) protein
MAISLSGRAGEPMKWQAMTLPFVREILLHVAKTLPAAPQLLSKLGRLRLEPDADLDEATAILKVDASLTARILRIANSPAYTSGSPYASLEQALARVGFVEIYRIAGIAAVAQLAGQGLRTYGVTGARLRENSLLSALIMEQAAGTTGIDPQDAYSTGLLRSTGKVAIDGLTRDSAYAGTYDPGTCGDLVEWEGARAGIGNCDAAAFVLTEWRFPASMVAAIGRHYLVGPCTTDRELTSLLNLSAGEAERLGYGLPGERPYLEATEEKFHAAGIGPDQLGKASAAAFARFEAVRSTLG